VGVDKVNIRWILVVNCFQDSNGAQYKLMMQQATAKATAAAATRLCTTTCLCGSVKHSPTGSSASTRHGFDKAAHCSGR